MTPLASRLLRASPRAELERRRLLLAALGQRLQQGMRQALASRSQALTRVVAGLETLSPLATLTRGYAILTQGFAGRIVCDTRQVTPGERLEARLARGRMGLEVVDILEQD